MNIRLSVRSLAPLALALCVSVASAQDFAPNSIAGRTAVVLISNGSGLFPQVGGYRVAFGADGGYAVTPLSNTVNPSTGTFTYTRLTGTTGRINIVDTTNAASLTQNLTFTSPTTATYSATHSFGTQSGTLVFENVVTTVPAGPNAGMANLSVRAQVPANGQIIPGVVLATATRLLVRAGGPALAAFGAPGTLANPRLTVYAGTSGTLVLATNEDWSSTTANRTAVTEAAARTGAFPYEVGSRDAALVLDLQPGEYTFMVQGAPGTTGEVLLEVYRVPIEADPQ